MNIKQKIIETCDVMIDFWEKFKTEIEAIPNENEVDVICKWHDYYQMNSDAISDLIITRMRIDEVEKNLIEKGKLKYID